MNNIKLAKCDHSPGRKQPIPPPSGNWSEVFLSGKNTLWGHRRVRKIPEGYVIIEMYTTSRNRDNLTGVNIIGERYWPVKIKHRSICRSYVRTAHKPF